MILHVKIVIYFVATFRCTSTYNYKAFFSNYSISPIFSITDWFKMISEKSQDNLLI